MKFNLKFPKRLWKQSLGKETAVNLRYHLMKLEELAKEFNTSLTDGIEQDKAKALLVKNGKNKIKHKKENMFLKVLSYFFTGFCGLIWIAAIVCILCWKPIGNPPDPANLGLGILLIIVILLQAAFTAFQDWSSSKVMKSIKNMMPSNATVIRSGHEMKIPVEEVVIGDLVYLSYGNKVPADVRIIESHDLKFDKSMLTGESEAIEGTVECTNDIYVESKNIAFMTTLITNGQGKGIVVSVGAQTMMGKIAKLTQQSGKKKTTLQKELNRFVTIVAAAAIFMAIVVVIVWSTFIRNKHPSYIDVPNLLVNTISVMIAFIPEGLPVCVTLSLLIIAKRMAKSRVLVKNLSVIETLSCVNVIASDKTGTLTQNKMFVANAAAGMQVETIGSEKLNNNQKTTAINQLIAVSCLCNNGSFDEDDLSTPVRQRKANGDATDIALLKFSTENEKYIDLKSKYQELSEIPFNSKNKWMMKIVKPENQEIHNDLFGNYNDESNPDLILLKGAPDYLLKKSIEILQPDGSSLPITAEIFNQIIKIQNDWCINGQRVLLLCKKKCNYASIGGSSAASIASLEDYVHRSNDFTIVGLVGIIDPPREGIADVISKCKSAGIKVLMVTGDYALTAAAIAVQIGIFTASQYDTAETMRLKYKAETEPYEKLALLLNGNDLENFSDDDWRIVTGYKEIVLARTTPEQKLKTVKEFQRDGFVVGVTGDGVNDAPALKSADIGIAMGSGSEVAMEASQLVLLDNNFSSILIAIKNGRLVFCNLRKVILYLLPGGCMAELVPVLMSVLIGVQQNLSSFQMIIISLFTDIAPSLSLMMEKEEENLLELPPRSKKDHLVDWKFLLQAYGFLGVLICFFSQCMYFIYMRSVAGINPSEILFSFKTFSDSPVPSLNCSNSNSTNCTSIFQLSPNEYYLRGTTVTFVSIILLQIFGNLLSTRTHKKSFFQYPPWNRRKRNLWVHLAQLISISMMLIIVYVPIFHKIFNTRPIPVEFLFLPLAFCLIIIVLDEIRKFCVRKNFLCFSKIGW